MTKIYVRGSPKRRGYVRYTKPTLKQTANTIKTICKVGVSINNINNDANTLFYGTPKEKIKVAMEYFIPPYGTARKIITGAQLIRKL